MGLLGWLFGSKLKVAQHRPPAVRPEVVRIKPPRKRGVPPEEYDANFEIYREEMRDQFRATARFERERREAIGFQKYKWRGGEDGCDIGRRNEGKTFSSDKPPKDSHPGEGRCNSEDWCRCYAETVVPGFK